MKIVPAVAASGAVALALLAPLASAQAVAQQPAGPDPTGAPPTLTADEAAAVAHNAPIAACNLKAEQIRVHIPTAHLGVIACGTGTPVVNLKAGLTAGQLATVKAATQQAGGTVRVVKHSKAEVERYILDPSSWPAGAKHLQKGLTSVGFNEGNDGLKLGYEDGPPAGLTSEEATRLLGMPTEVDPNPAPVYTALNAPSR